ncbi:MAG: exo-alpha-sialidase [Burkholderiales bacterium]|nr:exo-alpha-sialidase [Phycisphaerae bacterium]
MTRLLVGTAKGLFAFHSSDGRSWHMDGPFLAGWEVSATLVKAGRWYTGTTHYAYGATIRVSDDRGATWRQPEGQPRFDQTPGSPSAEWKVNRIWELMSDPSRERIYVGIDEAALFASDDRAETWNEVESLTRQPSRKAWFAGGGGLCLHTIIPHPTNPDRMWLGISAVGAFRTDDGGKSWKNLNRTLPALPTGSPDETAACCVHRIAIDPAKPDMLYMQYHGAVMRTLDAGENWERIETGLPGNFGFPMVCAQGNRLLVIPLENEGVRYVPGGALRVYASENSGQSWHESGAGLPDDPRFTGVLRSAMAADAQSPVVAFGTTSGELFASADSGRTWQPIAGQFPRIMHVSISHDD